MIDNSILERYIAESGINMTDESQQKLLSLIRQLLNTKTDVEINDLTRQDFIDIFSQKRILTAQTFYPYKSKMSDFLVWMKENGYCSDAPVLALISVRYEDISRQGLYETYYFRDYDDLTHAMDVVLLDRAGDFDTFKVAATLVWAGIQLEYAIDIKKEDYDDEAGSIIHPLTKETVYFPPLAANLLSEYKKADGFISRKCNGIVIQYVNSPYLLRTYRSEHLEKHGLSHYSVVVNNLAKEGDKKFQWSSIYLSGLYYRMYLYETEHGKIGRTNYELLKKFFSPDPNKVLKNQYSYGFKYDEYCEFRDCMYS